MIADGPKLSQPPRSVALSGVIFSLLDMASLVLIRTSVPADPAEPGVWLADPAYQQLLARLDRRLFPDPTA
jgi:hypothetical protein